MLSLLLAVLETPDGAPAALCPPCHPDDVPFTFTAFLFSIIKSLVSLAVVVFPLYKTFKAWESNRLKACRAMLAYWSAITLLNAMKDVTDEIVGNWMHPYLHHLIVATIKLAPLVLVRIAPPPRITSTPLPHARASTLLTCPLCSSFCPQGPDVIYHYTVRPFFEQHEGEMDSVIMKANIKAAELKHDLQPMIRQVKQTASAVEHAMEPTIEQAKHTLMDTTHRVEHALGLDKDREADASPVALSAEEAVRKDEELTVQADPTSATGLRQRSKQPTSSTAASAATGGLAPQDEAEIARAKANEVLVEKLVWGHALHAKNEEYQRQVKQKESLQDDLQPAMHQVQAEYNPTTATTDTTTTTTTQPAAPATSFNVTAAPASQTSHTLAHPGPPVVESHPPLSAFPAPPAVVPPTIASSTSSTSTSSTLSTSSTPSVVTVQDVSRLKGMSTAGVVTASTVDGSTTGTKTQLLESRGLPQIVHTTSHFSSEQQKEL